MSTVSERELKQLREHLGDRLNTEPALLAHNVHDSSTLAPEGAAVALVLAESTEDVSAALSWANEHEVPVSVRGAGTGLAGGANAYPGGLIISLERMNSILQIDAENRLAVVEAGVITATLDAAAKQHGLFFPPYPSCAATTTVGGNFATIAGGLRCVAHGVTTDSVAALEVVLADGRIMRTGSRTRKNVVGYDLKSLFTGSEGTLGIITSATVRLKAIAPGIPRTFRAGFDSIEDAGRAVTAIVNGPHQPEILELLDTFSVEAVEAFHPTGVEIPKGAMLVGQTTGLDANERAEAIAAICTVNGASSTEVSESDSLLEARRLANPALNALGLRVSCDVAVPVASLAEVFNGLAEISKQHGLRISNVAHAGDGNLHCVVESNPELGGEAAAELVIDDITRYALSMGGTISGEHGIGAVKRHELPWQLDEASLAVQFAIKHALDPKGILTPARAI